MFVSLALSNFMFVLLFVTLSQSLSLSLSDIAESAFVTNFTSIMLMMCLIAYALGARSFHWQGTCDYGE